MKQVYGLFERYIVMRRIFSVAEINNQIFKIDGSKKKVILYSLGTSSLIKDGGALLAKLERNLQVFEENKDDIFVIFTCQKEIEEKIKLVRANLLETYHSVINKYEDSDFCIVVDSDDIEDMYEICDAFYGDWGEGAWRCRLMGKPVMIQNAQVD